MAVKDGEDKAPKRKDVDTKKSDVKLRYESDEHEKFKLEPQKAPHNKAVDGKPLDTSKDKYNEAKRVDNNDGEEAIKTAREKFAKKKDDPPGIAAAKENTNSIKESLNQTDPQRKSQVLPQMYDKFGMITGILKSSSSGQQGQSAQQIQAGQPDFYQDLDGNTKRLLISAVTHGWAILTRNFGYQKVLKNIAQATTGYYTKQELDALNWFDPEFTPTVFRFDRFSEDYQDVLVTSVSLLGQLYKKYGEENIPFIQPFYKPRTLKTPPTIVTTPSLYSTLRFYPNSEFTTISFNGETDVSSNNFIKIPGNPLVNNDVVIYKADLGNNSVKGLLNDAFYYVVEANTSGFKLALAPKGSPVVVEQSTTSVQVAPRVLLTGVPVVFNAVNITSIIIDRFNRFLRRIPQKDELTFWENAFLKWLRDEKISVPDALKRLDDSFKNSDEYAQLTNKNDNNQEEQVNEAVIQNPVFFVDREGKTRNLSLIVRDKYRTFLKRDPDLKGLNFWIDVYKSYIEKYDFHAANMKIAEEFKASPEYKKLNNIPIEKPPLKPVTTQPVVYVDASGRKVFISAIIRDKYRTFLKREPDQDGMTFWEGVFKVYVEQYGQAAASNKLNEDFRASPEYRELNQTNRPRQLSDSNTNITPIQANTVPVKIVTSPGSNSTLTLVEEYPGYARWDGINGGIEYMLRTQFLPDFETPELLVVYLSAYSFAADLFSVIPQEKLDYNLLAILLDKYTRKIENDYNDYTLGWGVSTERAAEQQDFNQNPETGGSGSNNNMLQQLLPQLQQLIQQAKQNHLPKSVLEQEKMRKLLENLKQKKTENKRMANFADQGVGGDGIGGLGSIFQNGGMGNLLGQLQGFQGGGGGGGGAAAGNVGDASIGTAGATITTTGNVATAQTGTASLSTLIGGTTDGVAVVKTFKTEGPVYIINKNIETPPAPVIIDVGGGITKDIRQIIRDKYRTFLKREPDAAGWEFWINVFREYLKTTDWISASARINKEFKESLEYIRNQNPKIQLPGIPDDQTVLILDPVKTAPVTYKGFNISAVVRDKYLTFLNREPDQNGMTVWENFMKEKIDTIGFVAASLELTKEIKNSIEYKEKTKTAKVNSVTKPVPEIKTDNITGFEGEL